MSARRSGPALASRGPGAVPTLALALVAGCVPAAEDAGADGSTRSSETLRAPDEVTAASQGTARAIALFAEMGKVLRHPRCVNCHPSGDRPLQGEDGRPHEPDVVRGASGMGRPGMLCTTCHAAENVRVMSDWSMPGHPGWHLAPASMAWAGRSLGEICAQLKDPARNGGMTLDELAEHLAEDGLVGWAWAPGAGRERAPGSQETFGALGRAWVDAGAGCPRAAAD